MMSLLQRILTDKLILKFKCTLDLKNKIRRLSQNFRGKLLRENLFCVKEQLEEVIQSLILPNCQSEETDLQ